MPQSHHIVITAPEIVANDGRLLRQAEAIKQAGHQISLCAPKPIRPQKNMTGVHYFEWAPPFWSLLSKPLPAFVQRFCAHRLMLFAWQKALKSLKPDLILASAPEALIAAALSKAGPIVYDAHEFYEEEFDDLGRGVWVQKTHNRFGHAIDLLLTVSPGIAALYQQTYPDWPKAHLFYNSTAFVPVPPDGRLKTKAGIGASSKIIIFHGLLGPHRGLEILPKLAKILPDPLVIIVMGDGPLKDWLKCQASDKLRVLDPVSYHELAHWLAEADRGLLLYEPISQNQLWCAPNKFFEYSAMGIKMVATDLPGLRAMDQGDLIFVPQAPSADDLLSAIQLSFSENYASETQKNAINHNDQITEFIEILEDLILKNQHKKKQ